MMVKLKNKFYLGDLKWIVFTFVLFRW